MTSEWTKERIADLTRHWNDGLTTQQIARMMGITKNKVIGKAHRLKLPSRQSPIKRDSDMLDRNEQIVDLLTIGYQQKEVAQRLNLPKSAVQSVAAKSADAGRQWVPGHRLEPYHPTPPEPKPITRITMTRVHECCWPIGDPKTKSFRYCGEPADLGRPYCAEHISIAYVRPYARREDAA